jgi:8-oxo-dGTP pyrophosphatase MutT (NUDIX family)
LSLPDEPAWMRPNGPGWRHHSERLVYETPWISVHDFDAEAPTGARTVYGVVRYKNLAIGILPIFDDGSIMLVGQHRFPLRDYSWEIPEGGVHVGDDVLEGARRELREEAGLEAREWRQVLSYQLSNSVSDERGHGLIATGLTQTQAEIEQDPTEAIALARLPFREALDLALAGRIWDVITLAMLLRAYHMASEGLLPEDLAMAMLARTGGNR